MAPRLRLELAQASDDAELRRIAADIAMPGDARVAYLREPSFFDALGVEGRRSEVVVVRDARGGRLVGMGCRSVKTAFVNGRPQEVGYLSGLRLEPEHRGGTAVARAHRLMRERCQQDEARLYLASILEDNRHALRLLTSGRADLPAYHDLGRLHVRAIAPRQARRRGHRRHCPIRAAGAADVGAIVRFLKREGAKRQFFPLYEEDDFSSATGLLQGLSVGDVLLAEEDRALVGVAGVWNQKPFRQSRVKGYAAWMGLTRPLLNTFARLTGRPALPRPGSVLDYRILAAPCVRENDAAVFEALVGGALLRCEREGCFLLVAAHERDPLLAILNRYRGLSFVSRLFVVCWDRGREAFDALDGRLPYVELGAL